MGKEGNYNAYITDEKYRESFDGATNMEDQLDVSLVKFVTDLFVDKLKEIAPESADIYTYDSMIFSFIVIMPPLFWCLHFIKRRLF